jgi:hypothetical protein
MAALKTIKARHRPSRQKEGQNRKSKLLGRGSLNQSIKGRKRKILERKQLLKMKILKLKVHSSKIKEEKCFNR